MNQLSTQLYRIDFKELIDNATNKKFWSQKWEIFKYGNISVEFSLSSISVKSLKLFADIKVIDSSIPNGQYSWESNHYKINSMTIPLQEEHFNEVALNKELVGKVNDTLRILGDYNIKLTDTYLKVKETEDDLETELERLANDFLDNNNVTNEAIREVYIENYVEKNMKSLADDYIYQNRDNEYVPCRATFAYVMGCDEKAESIIRNSNLVDCDWILEDANEIALQLESGDMRYYEDELDDI